MTTYILPASPSWYCSKISACSLDKKYFVGAKQSVYVFDITVSPPEFLESWRAHTERIVSLALSPDETQIITAGDDGLLKVWMLETKTVLVEHRRHEGRPTVVDWSCVDKDLVVSGDDRGELVCWWPRTERAFTLVPEPSQVICLVCSPHHSNLAAVGYRNCIIVLVELSKRGAVLQRLRGHDEEVHGLCWCPQVGETIEQIPQGGDGCLIASVSRDRTLRVWSSTTGVCLLNLALPSQARRRDDPSKVKLWCAIHWPNAEQLITSAHHGAARTEPYCVACHVRQGKESGDMLLWNIFRAGKQKWQNMVTGEGCRGHYRIIFNICSSQDRLCTISMDRQIVMWDLTATQAISAIPSLGGFVYALDFSPIQPGRLAIGAGDNLLRVWNYGNPTNPYEIQIVWQGIHSKITALKWHPEKEGLLAYGTDDGRVGVYDILVAKPPSMVGSFHKKTVYSVAWGPECPSKESDSSYSLYSCGDGQINMHSAKSHFRDTKNLNKLIQAANPSQTKFPIRSEVAWKPDFSVLAIGNDNGSVELFRAADLCLIAVVLVHRKLINCIRWHPEYTAESASMSPCHAWLAIASNETTICVVDTAKIFDSPSSEVVIVTESICQLSGHTARVTNLAWSLHVQAMLVSGSYDGTAQVWNVKDCSPVGNFRCHTGRLLSVAWSDLDPDLVFSGSEDYSLRSWRVSQLTHKSPPAGKEYDRRPKKAKSKKKKVPTGGDAEARNEEPSKVAESDVVTNEPADEMAALMQLVELKKQQILQQSVSDGEKLEVDLEQSIVQPQTDVYNKLSSKLDPRRKVTKRKGKSLFPLSASHDHLGKEIGVKDCLQLAQCITNGEPLPERSCQLGIFRDMGSTVTALDKEVRCHQERGHLEQHTQLLMLGGNLESALRLATDKYLLSDYHVALAASVSHERWREVCLAYAQQLSDSGFYHKATSFFLAADAVQQALDMLLSQALFREALWLARLRMPDSPIISDILLGWAQHLSLENNHEQAAKCYLSLGEPIQAAQQLAMRLDHQALCAASKLSLLTGETELARAYAWKYCQQCLLSNDWTAFTEFVDDINDFKWLALVAVVHRALIGNLNSPSLASAEAQSPAPQQTLNQVDKPPSLEDIDRLPTLETDQLTEKSEIADNNEATELCSSKQDCPDVTESLDSGPGEAVKGEAVSEVSHADDKVETQANKEESEGTSSQTELKQDKLSQGETNTSGCPASLALLATVEENCQELMKADLQQMQQQISLLCANRQNQTDVQQIIITEALQLTLYLLQVSIVRNTTCK